MPLKIVFPIAHVATQVVAAKQQTTCKYTTRLHVSVCVCMCVSCSICVFVFACDTCT